jgi:hypothetical protein
MLPGLSVAPVTATSKDNSVTPVGGVSVIVSDTAEAPGAGGDVTVIVAVALFVVSLTEVAVSATVAGLGTAAGALYVTELVVMLVSEPQVAPLQPVPERAQVTPLLK